MPWTSNALVLLNTIRFRIALRSPGAGGRPVFTKAFFLMTSVLPPFTLGRPLLGFLAGGAGLLWMAVVEKAAAGGGRRAASFERPWDESWTEGRRAHFQQLAEAMAGVGDKLQTRSVTDEVRGLTLDPVSRHFGASHRRGRI